MTDAQVDLQPQGLLQEADRRAREGDVQGSLAVLSAILNRWPGAAEASALRGNLLLKLGQPGKALEDFNQAIDSAPSSASLHGMRGQALIALGNPAGALEAFNAAIKGGSAPAGLVLSRGELLVAMHRMDEALADFRRAGELEPHWPLPMGRCASLLLKMGRPADALIYAERAMRLAPNEPLFINSYGVSLLDLDRPDEAVAAFQKALSITPDSILVLNNYGSALREAGLVDEAIAVHRRVLEVEPGHLQAGLNLGGHFRLKGLLDEGLRLMELRRVGAPALPHVQPEWTGEQSLRGKRIFVTWEQGLGDTIQFCRYLPLLRERGADVVFSCQEGVRALISTLDQIEVIGERVVPEKYDFHIPLPSLPLAFKAGLNSLPFSGGYLDADPERVRAWRLRLGEHGLKIGVVWQGKVGGHLAGRSYPLAALSPLAEVGGVRLISLQRGEGVEQLANLPFPVEELGDFDPPPNAFLDTAAIMGAVDLVITPDTATAHLAGALGAPAWVALKHVPEWRWMLDREDSPWYKSLRLFRQSRRGDWRGVFVAMADRLRSQGLNGARFRP